MASRITVNLYIKWNADRFEWLMMTSVACYQIYNTRMMQMIICMLIR